jgi:hypothetical protein
MKNVKICVAICGEIIHDGDVSGAPQCPPLADNRRNIVDSDANTLSDLPPKRRKFRDLAENRTARALEAIRRIGNLSNPQLYEWEEAEVRKILKSLKDAVSEVEGRFAAPRSKANAKFKL